jgi:hypothetical protein
MQRGSVVTVEKWVDRTASALFAAASAYGAFMWFAPSLKLLHVAVTGTVAAGAYLASIRTLGAVVPETHSHAVPIFDVREIDQEPDELLLTDRHEPVQSIAPEPLILDDILEKLGPESRVVRLFDPAAMPTPGQLEGRIRRHLSGSAPGAGVEDASEALHEALAELRRSLG